MKVFQSFSSPMRASGRLRQPVPDGVAQPGSARGAAVVEGALRLPQQAHKMPRFGFLRFTPCPLGLARSLDLPFTFLRGRGGGLRLRLLLASRFRGGECRGPLALRFRLGFPVMACDHLASALELLPNLGLGLGACLRRQCPPAGLGLAERCLVGCVVRPLGEARDRRRGCLQVGLQLLARPGLGGQLVTLGSQDLVDGVILAAARGPDQLAQLPWIGDGSRRHLAYARRTPFDHPLADRRHVARAERLRQLRFFLARAGLAIGLRRLCLRFGLAGRWRRGRGLGLAEQA